MPRFSVVSAAAQVQAHYNTIGPSPKLKLFDGGEPNQITDPDNGTMLVELTLPASWAEVLAGVLTNQVVWSGVAVATGAAQHYRLYAANGICHEQGYISDGNFTAPQIATGDTVQFPIGNYKLAHFVPPPDGGGGGGGGF